MPATYAAALKGALDAQADRYRADRDLALLTAYFSGQLANADWHKVPPYAQWLRNMTEGRRPATDAEIVARFEAWARSGLDVTAH